VQYDQNNINDNLILSKIFYIEVVINCINRFLKTILLLMNLAFNSIILKYFIVNIKEKSSIYEDYFYVKFYEKILIIAFIYNNFFHFYL
jgi:hypothetical protein